MCALEKQKETAHMYGYPYASMLKHLACDSFCYKSQGANHL